VEKVTGIGGLFFRAHDPKALGSWYQQHLGVSLTPSSYEEPVWSKRQASRLPTTHSEATWCFPQARFLTATDELGSLVIL